ncbi:MAG: hypothetical protein C4294_13655 [Nitrospiraceae bacterium]
MDFHGMLGVRVVVWLQFVLFGEHVVNAACLFEPDSKDPFDRNVLVLAQPLDLVRIKLREHALMNAPTTATLISLARSET